MLNRRLTTVVATAVLATALTGCGYGFSEAGLEQAARDLERAAASLGTGTRTDPGGKSRGTDTEPATGPPAIGGQDAYEGPIGRGHGTRKDGTGLDGRPGTETTIEYDNWADYVADARDISREIEAQGYEKRPSGEGPGEVYVRSGKPEGGYADVTVYNSIDLSTGTYTIQVHQVVD